MHLKGKETLEQIYRILTEELTYGVDAKTLVEPIAKDLEVLEIIKNKQVVIDWHSKELFTFDTTLTEKEKETLKEWLENDK